MNLRGVPYSIARQIRRQRNVCGGFLGEFCALRSCSTGSIEPTAVLQTEASKIIAFSSMPLSARPSIEISAITRMTWGELRGDWFPDHFLSSSVTPRCEYGSKIFVVLAFAVHLISVSLDKACAALGFFCQLPLSNSQLGLAAATGSALRRRVLPAVHLISLTVLCL